MGEAEWVKECHYNDPSFPDRGVNFPSVWIDDKTKEWRMIYSVKWSPFTMMLATSKDGVNWEPLPAEGNFCNGEEKQAPNHILSAPSGSGSAIYHDPQKTDGYAFRIFGRQRGEPVYKRALADPNHPWHKVAKEKGETRYMDAGITYVSKDGLNWEIKAGGHWNWQQKDWYPEPPVFAFWNEQLQQHVMLARLGRPSSMLANFQRPQNLDRRRTPLSTRSTRHQRPHRNVRVTRASSWQWSRLHRSALDLPQL